MVAVETSKLLLIACQPTHPGMGGQALAGSNSGDTRKHAVRGVSLPNEVVELGVWAVLAVAFPPLQGPIGEEGGGARSAGDEGGGLSADEGEAVGVVSETVRKKIAQRYRPGLDTLLDGAVRLRNEVRDGRHLAISLGRYEKVRSGLAAANQVASRPGQAAWPPGAQTVAARLGGGAWAEALRALGVSAETGGRARGSGSLANHDFKAALAAFFHDCGEGGGPTTYSAYCAWVQEERANGRHRPSGSAVRQRYASWSGALAANG